MQPRCASLSVLLILSIIVTVCLSYEETTVYEQYTDARLYCSNDTDLMTYFNMSVTPTSWMLPNLTILKNGTEKFVFQDDYWTLLIRNVTENDLGQYHCMTLVQETNEWYLVKLGLNTRGPYFQDLWKKYEMNTIIGISAAGGFIILAVATILIYKFRWVDPYDRKSTRSSITLSSSSDTSESRSHHKDPIKGNDYGINHVFDNRAYEDLADTRF